MNMKRTLEYLKEKLREASEQVDYYEQKIKEEEERRNKR